MLNAYLGKPLAIGQLIKSKDDMDLIISYPSTGNTPKSFSAKP